MVNPNEMQAIIYTWEDNKSGRMVSKAWELDKKRQPNAIGDLGILKNAQQSARLFFLLSSSSRELWDVAEMLQ